MTNYLIHVIPTYTVPSRVAILCGFQTVEDMFEYHNKTFDNHAELKDIEGLIRIQSPADFKGFHKLLLPKDKYNQIIDNRVFFAKKLTFKQAYEKMKTTYPNVRFTFHDVLNCNLHLAKRLKQLGGDQNKQIGKNYGLYVPGTGVHKAMSSYKTKSDMKFKEFVLEKLKKTFSLTDLLYLNPELCAQYNGPNSTIGVSAFVNLYNVNQTGHEFPKYKNLNVIHKNVTTLRALAKKWGGSVEEWLRVNKDNSYQYYDKNKNGVYDADEKIVLGDDKKVTITYPFEASIAKETIKDFDEVHKLQAQFGMDHLFAPAMLYDTGEDEINFGNIYNDYRELKPSDEISVETIQDPKSASSLEYSQIEAFVDYLLPYIEGTKKIKKGIEKGYCFSNAMAQNSGISLGYNQGDIRANDRAQWALTKLLEQGYKLLKTDQELPKSLNRASLWSYFQSEESIRQIINNAKRSKTIKQFSELVSVEMLQFLEHIIQTAEGKKIIDQMDANIRRDTFIKLEPYIKYAKKNDLLMKEGLYKKQICPFLVAEMAAAMNQYGNLNGLDGFMDSLKEEKLKLTFQNFRDYILKYKKNHVGTSWYQNIALIVRELTSVEFHSHINQKQKHEIYYVVGSGEYLGKAAHNISKMLKSQDIFSNMHSKSAFTLQNELFRNNKSKFGDRNKSNLNAGVSLKLPKGFQTAYLGSYNFYLKNK